jgi:hypothetical protein
MTTPRVPQPEDSIDSDDSSVDSDSDDSVASAQQADSVASNYNNKSAKLTKITVRNAKGVRPSVHTMSTRQSLPKALLTTATKVPGLVLYDDIGMFDVQALLAAAPTTTTTTSDPATYRKAMSSPFSEKRYEAMLAEYESLQSNNTADLVRKEPIHY